MSLHSRLTPTGVRIIHEDGLPDPETGKSKRRTYWLDEQTPDQKVPSITTALGVMHKESLLHAVERLAVKSSIALACSLGLPPEFDEAMGALKANGLSFRQQWNAKAGKGTKTHTWLERLLTNPDADVPEHCEGFAEAIKKWWDFYHPTPIQSEVMVCSTRHRFAGRFDLLAECTTGPLARHVTRIELKSTERIKRDRHGEPLPPYTENLWQLAAQELAAVESGDPPSERQAVLRVDEAGDFDFHVTEVEPTGYLAALRLYRALHGIPEPILHDTQLKLTA